MQATIPTQGSISTAEIQQRLAQVGIDIGQRTIQRDLMALRPLGLIVNTKSKPYGWSWASKRKSWSVLSMSTTEALAFHAAEQMLLQTLPASHLSELRPYFDAAKKQLAGTRSGSAKEWRNRIRTLSPSQPLLPPKIDPSIRKTVLEAVLERRALRIRYRDDPKTYTVHPVALVQLGVAPYLCAAGDRDDHVRTYALARIREAIPDHRAARDPAGFDLDQWLNSSKGFGFGGVGRRTKIVLRFSNGAGNHLLDTPLSNDQTSKAGLKFDQLIIQATVEMTSRLQRWLRSFGDAVEVISPKGLKDLLN